MLIAWDESLREQELETDDVSEALQRVDALDGRERTLVTIYRGEAHAAAGGNAATGLVAYVTFDGTSFHQLEAAESTSDEEVTVTAGGQAGGYPRRLVVDVEAAKAAMQTFAESGRLDASQRWETS